MFFGYSLDVPWFSFECSSDVLWMFFVFCSLFTLGLLSRFSEALVRSERRIEPRSEALLKHTERFQHPLLVPDRLPPVFSDFFWSHSLFCKWRRVGKERVIPDTEVFESKRKVLEALDTVTVDAKRFESGREVFETLNVVTVDAEFFESGRKVLETLDVVITDVEFFEGQRKVLETCDTVTADAKRFERERKVLEALDAVIVDAEFFESGRKVLETLNVVTVDAKRFESRRKVLKEGSRDA
jgi:hypothetical protein